MAKGFARSMALIKRLSPYITLARTGSCGHPQLQKSLRTFPALLLLWMAFVQVVYIVIFMIGVSLKNVLAHVQLVIHPLNIFQQQAYHVKSQGQNLFLCYSFRFFIFKARSGSWFQVKLTLAIFKMQDKARDGNKKQQKTAQFQELGPSSVETI